MNLSATQAVDAYRAALPPGQLVEFALTPLDRLGIPVQALTLFPSNEAGGSGLSWPLCEGIGYGETAAAARVGAYGELTEEVSSSAALATLPRLTGSYREMLARHGERGVVDPVTLCLEAGSLYTPDTVLEWVEGCRWTTGEPALIPAEFVACAGMDVPPLPGVARLVTPITNGHGAGTTLAMAQAHGLLELLQRDGNSVHYRALAGTTAIDPSTITDPTARALLERYDAAGIEIVIKVAATDFGCVNLYVVGHDRPESGGGLPVMAAACGEAVHPLPEVALRKALLEFASSRARLALFHGPLEVVRRVAPPGYLEAYRKIVNPADEEPRGLAGMQRWVTLDLAGMREVLAPVFAVRKRVSFAALPLPENLAPALDHASLLRLTVTRLEQAGFDVLFVDLPLPGTGVYAVKMIVPGLEVETMSYRRIGERNIRRLLARQAAEADFPTLVGFGDGPVEVLPIPLTDLARLRLGGKVWLDHCRMAELMRDLYVLYREPSRHVTIFSSSEGQKNCQRTDPLG